ncbi:MAG: SET domain-containing protein-lysine N-methyltransferase [Chlamydiae bacterium]|nr:SET domain-containing protein-lysine N-methyltransferase [Chlamydiota bacterium]
MNKLLKKFHLVFSQGIDPITKILKKHARKTSSEDLPYASKKLLKEIGKFKKDLEEEGIPANLVIAEVNPYIHTGVFLKPTAKTIPAGTFIGVYSGDYELVLETETKDNHYSYDLAPGIKIKKEDLAFVRSKDKKLSTKDSFSVQTTALFNGNFTRFINHSSYDNNIEAARKRMPDDTIEICLFASKEISPGHQLLSSYGGQYWAVLPIIPEPIRSDTYILNKKGKVTKTNKEIPGRITFDHPLFIAMRNTLELETTHLGTSFNKFLAKQKISPLTKKQVAFLEQFEDEILERGLPLSFDMRSASSVLHWDIILAKGIDPIAKGSLIGVMGGTWSLLKNPSRDDYVTDVVYQNKRLVLRQDKHTNFLKFLTHSPTGNVKVLLRRNEETNELFLFLQATKDLIPMEKLKIKRD